jgi:hypothetical protein
VVPKIVGTCYKINFLAWLYLSCFYVVHWWVPAQEPYLQLAGPITPVGAVAFSIYTLKPFIHIFVTFWEVTAIDLQPHLCPWKWQSFSGSDLKKKTDMPERGSGVSEEVPQYNVCHFVVTQAVTNALGIVLQEKWYFITCILGDLRVPIDGPFFYNSLMTVASLGINYMV